MEDRFMLWHLTIANSSNNINRTKVAMTTAATATLMGFVEHKAFSFTAAQATLEIYTNTQGTDLQMWRDL